MLDRILIQNVSIVNEGAITIGDVYIENGVIAEIGSDIRKRNVNRIDGTGKFLFPGVIDDQVHFREPGLTQKADIASESRAAVAGGVTSFMEMPNTNPPVFTQELLQHKYDIAQHSSWANYSFYMGASNDNISELLKTDPNTVCGLKVFMGSSTGNLLVDNEEVLGNIFSKAHMLVATHCEDEATVRSNLELARIKYGENVPMREHADIRNVDACYISSSKAVQLAKEFNTRLHILHISTAKELDLFTNQIPLAEKRITSEVCVHHLWFDADDYAVLGSQIKCNPSIKESENRKALFTALRKGYLDVIATDHAPHTWQEKQGSYFSAPSGVPLVQHSLAAMLEFVYRDELTMPEIAHSMSHAPAILFNIENRGYIREGYAADLVLVEAAPNLVEKSNIYYKCGWSPFEGHTFHFRPILTLVNGNPVYQIVDNQPVFEFIPGQRLRFNRV